MSGGTSNVPCGVCRLSHPAGRFNDESAAAGTCARARRAPAVERAIISISFVNFISASPQGKGLVWRPNTGPPRGDSADTTNERSGGTGTGHEGDDRVSAAE